MHHLTLHPQTPATDSQAQGFSRVALLCGRNPLFWHTRSISALDQARRLSELLRFCLELPGTQLGVKGEQGERWLSGAEANAWAEGMRVRLEGYAPYVVSLRDETELLKGFLDLRCTVFAPFQAEQFLETARRNPRLADKMQKIEDYVHGTMDELSATGLSNYQLYWSWRLSDYAGSNDRLIYTPMLALWSYYPTGGRWAPAPPMNLQEPPCISISQASDMLQKVFWYQLESAFAEVRAAYLPGQANTDFAGIDVRPPRFYYAEPATLPRQATDYATSGYAALADLVKACLSSDDPFAFEVSWGVLEGDFLTLRRAVEDGGRYDPWYLILPFARKEATIASQELEYDLNVITNSLNYVEFAVSHAAWDAYTDIELLSSRQGHWQATLDQLNKITVEAVEFLPSLQRGDARQVNAEFGKLLVPLRQVQVSLERVNGQVELVQRKFGGSTDGTEDYLRRRLTLAPFPHDRVAQLRDALLDAYPFHFVRNPLKRLQDSNDYLLGSVGRVLETANSLLAEADRRTRESLIQWTERLGIVLALVALVIALPSFIPGATLETGHKGLEWLEPYLPAVALATSYVVGAALIGLFVTLVFFILNLLFDSSSEKPEQFVAQKQIIAELSGKDYASEVDREAGDRRAAALLHELWLDLKQPDRHAGLSRWLRFFRRRDHIRNPRVKQWLQSSQRLRFLVCLFDLAPDYIYLPRTLCIYRYKSRDFLGAMAVSAWAFEQSLRGIGFEYHEINALRKWLDEPTNSDAIRSMDVAAFDTMLRQHRVTAVSEQRDSNLWQGPLASPQASAK